MIAIIKAFRDALVADATLLTLIPAANIYAGLRDEKTSIPAVDIFVVSDIDEPYAGAAIGGMTKANVVIQVSIFARKESDAWAIAERVKTVLLDDNETLNTAGVKNMFMTGRTSLREANLSHIPIRFSFNYHWT